MNDKLSLFSQADVVLVPNFRLARTWQPLLNQYMAKAEDVFHEVPVQAQGIFLERLFQKHCQDRVILSPLQEGQLWLTEAQDLRKAYPLLNVTQFAKLCQDAYARLVRAQVSWDDAALQEGEDVCRLMDIIRRVQWRLQAHDWILSTDIPTWLAQNHVQPDAAHIVCFGHIQMSQDIQNLFASWQSQGIVIDPLGVSDLEIQPQKKQVAFEDSQQEIHAALEWAHETWRDNPEHRIAVVIDNLEDHKEMVQVHLESLFDLEQENTWRFALETPYDISAGKILSSIPIIETGMLWLRLVISGLPFEGLSFLLRSPYWHGAKYQKNLARVDQLLREKGQVFWTFSALHRLLEQQGFSDVLESLREVPAFLKENSPLAWLDVWEKILQAVGFPGPRGLVSEEYQALQRWMQEMMVWTSLACIAPKLEAKPALEIFFQHLSTVVFQTKTPEARLEILGPLEAIAMPFDAIWITGMTDTSWPALAKPHPLIPVHLQKNYNMPQSSAEYETAYAKNKLSWITQETSQVIASFHHKDGDALLQPSPLIASWSKQATPKVVEQSIPPIPLVPYEDDEGAPISGRVQGGAYFLQAQAECPFKAYATYQLKAHALTSVERQLSPVDRGVVIHEVLERFWKDASLSSVFMQEGYVAIKTSLDGLIQSVMDVYFSERKEQFPATFWQLESVCIGSLLESYFLLEHQRKGFQVDAIEKSLSIRILNLEFTVRCDRIDITDDNETILIDYKTGKSTLTGWFNERLTMPQLPLYALFLETQPDALMITQIHYQDTAFKGISRFDDSVEGLKPWQKLAKDFDSWQALVDDWQYKVGSLAQEIQQGWASADPASPQVCAFCDLDRLCRYHMQ